MLNIREYVKVQSLEEAYELNQKRTNKVIGGMLWMKMGSRNIQKAIDLSGLGLDKIEETEEEFRESCAFLKEIGFLKVHVFPYSRRSGTPAYDFPDQVHEREKQARSREMNAIAEDIRREVLAGCEGSEDDVLLETPLSGTLFTGYTRLYVPVVVSAPGHKSGEIVHVRLGSYDGERVRAEMV